MFTYQPIFIRESDDERMDPSKPKGTYAAYRVSPVSASKVLDFCKRNNIANTVDAAKMHCTLLYSRREHADYIPNENLRHSCRFRGYSIFGTALVMLLDSEDMVHRHMELMDRHGATYDFEQYIPHITLAYDIPPEFKVLHLPAFHDEIFLEDEYKEDLNDD